MPLSAAAQQLSIKKHFMFLYVAVCFCYVSQFPLYFMFYVWFYAMALLCFAVCSLLYVFMFCFMFAYSFINASIGWCFV